MAPELAAKGIVNLKKDLHFWQLFVNSKPDFVDDEGDGGLRDPGNSFRENAIEPIEYIPAISKSILDESELFNLSSNSLVPGKDSWVSSKPDRLSALNFSDQAASICSHSLSFAAVVSSMTKYLCEFASVFQGASMVEISWMSFHKLFERRRLFSIEDKRICKVDVRSESKHSLK